MEPLISKNYFQLKGAEAETVVHELATKTFLIDWCFLNPKLPNGKELCDLLVVFDDIAIIWQIKDLKLDKDGKYKKAEVDKNLRQLAGARRQLFELETSVILQNPRRSSIPFDSSKINNIYLISVLMGEGEEVYSFIDEVKSKKVHVFTREFTQIVLRELDTISDFIKYIEAKESFIDTGKSLTIMGGEEEFMAYYLMNDKSFNSLDEPDHILMEEGSWKHLQSKPEYKSKKEADKISYCWDSIIDRTHEYYTWKSISFHTDDGLEQNELIARELARSSRFERRYLSKAFYEAHVKAHKEDKKDLFFRSLSLNGLTYCFLFQEDPEPRVNRKQNLASACCIARGRHKENQKVLGIATEMKFRPTCTYDFALIDLPIWTDEDQQRIEQLKKGKNGEDGPIWRIFHEDEYPRE